MNDETRTQVPQSPPASGTDADVGRATVAGSPARDHPPAAESHPRTVAQEAAGAARAAAESDPGARFGAAVPGYEIVGELGRGAMGIVYRARHVKLNRPVALKMTLGRRVGEKDLIRFLAEAEAVAAVKHDNVVQVYDYGESGGRPFMALELCSGGSLADRLEKGDPFGPRDAARLVGRIAAGVAAAHDEGIVHRDLKPGNVLLTTDGEPKIADFGLAKRGTSELTATQEVMGTPSYMSPEQAGGKTKFVGPQADVWALGVILYECLTGARPFPGATTDEVLAGVLRADPLPVRTLKAGTPRDLDLICRKCLEKNPADRYPTAAELADDLARFARGEPISARPLGAVPRAVRWAKRNPAVAGLMAVVVLVTLGLFGSLYGQYRQAVAQAAVEKDARESAEAAQQNAERAAAETARREEAERLRAAAETARREEAERLRAAADAETARANHVSEFMVGIFRAPDPLDFFGDTLIPPSWEKQRTMTAEQLLRAAADRFGTQLNDQPLTRAKLLASIGNSLAALGDYTRARPLLKEALGLRGRHLRPAHPDVVRSELDLGRLDWHVGDFKPALDRFRRADALQRQDGAPEEAVLTARFYEALALIFLAPDEAESVFLEVVRGRERRLGPNHPDTIAARIGLVALLLDSGRPLDALKLVPAVLDGVRAQPGGQFKSIGELFAKFQSAIAPLGLVDADPSGLLARRLYNQAEAQLRGCLALAEEQKMLPPDHVLLSLIRAEHGRVLVQLGRTAEAEKQFRRVLEDVRQTIGVAHPKVLELVRPYTDLLVRTGRLPEARAVWDEVAKANTARFGPENAWRTRLLLERAAFEARWGTLDAAYAAAGEAARLAKKGKLVSNKTTVFSFVAALAALSDRTTFADPRLTELYAVARPLVTAVCGAGSLESVIISAREGMWRYRVGDRAGGTKLIEAAETTADQLAPPLPPDQRAVLRFWRGHAELDRGRPAAAAACYEAALESARVPNSAAALYRTEAAIHLGYALALDGRAKASVAVFEEARRAQPAQKLAEPELAWAEMRVAVAQLAAGDPSEYRTTLEGMFRRYGKSKDGATLSRLAWAGGLSPTPVGWNPAELEAAAASSFHVSAAGPWDARGLALVRLRAGKFDAVEDALAKVGKTAHPVDHLIRGLVAAARNDRTAAREQLARAEHLVDAQKPSASNPFAYGGRAWNESLEAAILLAELRATVTPAVAPPPREKE